MRPVTTIFLVAATLATVNSLAQYQTPVPKNLPLFHAPKYGEPDLDGWKPVSRVPQAAKSTSSIGSRVIAITHRAFNTTDYTLIDSSTFSYSGTRGGDPNTAIKCDYSYTFFNGYKSKSTHTYNSSDNATSVVSQNQYGSSGTWTNTHRSTWTYDASNNITTKINENWDSVSASWTNDSKFSYTYTTTNKVASVTVQIGTPWTNSSFITFTYDGSDNPVLEVIKNWDNTAGVWVNQLKANYTFTSANLTSVATMLSWNASTSSWVNQGQTTYTYDASNRKTLDTYRLWNATTSTWGSGTNRIYSAYTGTAPQTIIEEQWQSAANAYVNSTKYNFTLNTYYQPITYSRQSWSGSGWELQAGDNLDQYYYEEYTTATPNIIPATDLTISPIPAADKIDITNNTTQPVSIIIIDLLGKCVASAQAPINPSHACTINVANFTNGIYFVKGTSNDGQSTTKTITIAK